MRYHFLLNTARIRMYMRYGHYFIHLLTTSYLFTNRISWLRAYLHDCDRNSSCNLIIACVFDMICFNFLTWFCFLFNQFYMLPKHKHTVVYVKKKQHGLHDIQTDILKLVYHHPRRFLWAFRTRGWISRTGLAVYIEDLTWVLMFYWIY